MSQEARRRLAARERLDPQPHGESEVPAPLRIRRFSEGLETILDRVDAAHVGRFSDGIERLPERVPSKSAIGRFSRGQDRGPDDDPAHLHVGRFSDGLANDAS